MKRLSGFLSLLFLFVSLSMPTFVFSTTRGIRVTAKQGLSLYLYKDYHALVVGISNYERWPKLPNAVNDAKEVATRLKALGFQVKLVLDPTAREMTTILNVMVYKTGNEENRALLFYYAGHGETEILADKTMMGYIVPRDCPLLEKDPMGFATHAISMRDIESVSLRIRCKHVLMLFDSCFSGSLFNLVRAVPKDISEKSNLPVRQYITAGREDEQVPDKSIFKRCLLIGLDGDADLTGDGYITGSELGMYLSDKVVNYSHRRQHPQYGKINNPDLDRGDFVFVPLKVRQRKEAKAKEAEEERSAIAEELKRLREERKRSEELAREQKKQSDELMRQLKRLLEEKSEKKGKESLAERKDHKEKVERAAQERQKRDEETDARIKELKAKHKAAEEKARREAAEKKALEDKLKRLSAEKEKLAKAKKDLKPKQEQEKRLAYIPKEVRDVRIQRIKLRSVPKDLYPEEIKKMVKKHNFFLKNANVIGDFPNEFVDNGDGTVTDKVTGLMWEKGGSESAIFWYKAKKYVDQLNKRKFSGHDDWRVPTLVELCSLLEPRVNVFGHHIYALFDGQQSECWSSDSYSGAPSAYREYRRIVNFPAGRIGTKASSSEWGIGIGSCFIRAVRTID